MSHPIDVNVSAKGLDEQGFPITSPSSIQSIRSAMNVAPMIMDDHEASPWDGNKFMNNFAFSLLIPMPRCPLPKHQSQPEFA